MIDDVYHRSIRVTLTTIAVGSHPVGDARRATITADDAARTRRRRAAAASWDEALDSAAAGFARAREADTSTSFGIFSCSKATNEMNFLAQKFARQVMGTNNIDSCNRT